MPTSSEIFFSYAWGDEKEEGDSREKLVNDLYQSLVSGGYTVIRDKYNLGYKGFISDFMVKIGHGNKIVVAISEKYLKSPYCMFELYEIARNSNFDKYQFRKKVLPIMIDFIDFTKPKTLDEHFSFWETEFNEWDTLVKKRSGQLSIEQLGRYDKIKMIFQNFGKLSDWIVDMNTLNPIILSKDNFDLIKKAIAEIDSNNEADSVYEKNESHRNTNKNSYIIEIKYSEDFVEHVTEITSDWILDFIKKSFEADIYIDSGSENGVKAGDYVASVFGMETLKTLTGQEIGRILEEDGTLLQVIEVFPEYSLCRIQSYAYDKHMDRVMKWLSNSTVGKSDSDDTTIELHNLCENLFPVLKGQSVLFPAREEGIIWTNIDDIYGQTLNHHLSNEEKIFLYKQLIRQANNYLTKYKLGEGYFFDSILFQKGYAQFQLQKFEDCIETYELYLDYFPNGKSKKGAIEWIEKSRIEITNRNKKG